MAFCEESLVSGNRTSGNSTGPNECFADLVNLLLNSLFIVMSVLLLLWFKCVEYQLSKGHRNTRFQEHSSRWILTICLISINLFECGEGILVYQSLYSYQSLHFVLTPCTSLVASFIAITFYHIVEKWNKPKLLLLLLMYWPLVSIIKVAKLFSLYASELTIQHLRLQLTWAAAVLYSLLTGIDVTVLCLQKYLCKKTVQIPCLYEDLSNIQYLHHFASLFQRATFSWLIPLLHLGYQRPLEICDLGKLPEKEMAEYQFRRFNNIFVKEKIKAEQQGKTVAMWICYFKTYWKTLAVGGIIKIVGDIVGLIGPLSISIILAYIANFKEGIPNQQPYYPTTWEFFQNGFVMTFIVLLATFLQSTFSNNFNHMAIAEGINLRSALQCMVYRKSLKMTTATGLDIGAVVNHMSVDSFNMMMLFSMGHYVWAVPFKIVLLLVLLYMHLGYSALIGAATIYILSPLQYYICTSLSQIQKKALKIADDRLKRTSELLQGIKLLKLYGWDSMYAKLIQDVREKELKMLKNDAIYVALNTFITQASSIVVTLVTFGIYSKIEGRPLTSSEVFTGLALFNQLTVPLYIIPVVIPIIINAMVSTKRLVAFLSQSEVDSNNPLRENDDGAQATVEFQPESGSVLLHVREFNLDTKGSVWGSDDLDGVFLPDMLNHSAPEDTLVTIRNGQFTWSSDCHHYCLRDINLKIASGKLSTVVGPVGSGKTSLISALLGELCTLNGSIQWNSTPTVAYVNQKAWLLNASLRDNILFGQPYDGRRYHQVVQACALQPDIDLLPARDSTEIGERGLNLSGGQKQRIALARAFYSQARLVILDDPLSALDAQVGAYVFEHGIKTLLLRRQRTVILVTHKLEYLSQASKIIVMDGGTIKHQGTMAEMEGILKELKSSWKSKTKKEKKKKRRPLDDKTSQERHKLVRLLSKQTLYRATSTQDVRPRTRLVSLARQMSHDPSSPLPCHDWGDYDDSLPSVPDIEDQSIEHNILKSMKSIESLRSRSSTSSGSLLRRSGRLPPSRLNSRISAHTEDLIEEEEEDQLVDDFITSDSRLDQPDAGKLVKEEERERGKISKQVYFTYMKACTLPLAVLVIFLIFATQGTRVGTDFWLSNWSNYVQNTSTTDSDPEYQHYLIGYAALSALGIIISLLNNLAAQLTSLKAVRALHLEMLSSIVKCPMRFFDSTPVGRILNRFSSDMSTIDKKLPVTLPVLLRFILLCISAILVDIIVTPYFLIFVIPIAAVYYFLQHFFRFTSRELQRLDSITKSPIFTHFSETLAGLTTIRAFRSEKRFIEMLHTYINVNNAAFILVNCANCWLGVALDYLGGFILFIATVSSMITAMFGSVTPAFVGMAMTYTLLVPIYLNWVVRNLASVEMYMSAVERVYNYSKLSAEEECVSIEKGITQKWPTKGEVIFDGVTMKYDTSAEPVLKNISLTFNAGEKIGICGRTGSGKSSLVMALFRILTITDGKITIDGVDITTVPLQILRSKLSIIPQESVLFSGSIRENLDPGKLYTDEEIWHALEIAQLKDLVTNMQGGLDGEVLEEGSNFSSGQCQLFCLARAILRNSNILVMDEATSSLDPETDHILQTVVASHYSHCTVISIAHRVSSILKYDKIVVLDVGRVAEVGHPEELLSRRGSIFASLVKASQQQH